MVLHRIPGERTPVGVRMADPPASIPEHWMFCNTARQFRAAVSSASAEEGQGLLFSALQTAPGAEELRARRVVERRDGSTAVGEWYVPRSALVYCMALRCQVLTSLIKLTGRVDRRRP